MKHAACLFIRTDGNDTIASGHIMRCLTIAEAVLQQGISVHFLVADSSSLAMLQSRMKETLVNQIAITVLDSDYRNPVSEITQIKELISTYENALNDNTLEDSLENTFDNAFKDSPNRSLLLLDSYFVTKEYTDALMAFTKVLYLDDLSEIDHKVDLIVNYDLIPDTTVYQSAGTVLAGAEYAPLRSDFAKSTVTLRPELQKILVITGGTNYHGGAECIATNLLDYRNKKAEAFSISILAGPIESASASLKKICRDNPFVTQYDLTKDMAKFLSQFDFILTAAGTTLYEICAMGIPAASFILADNQIPTAKAFDSKQIIPCLGSIEAATELAQNMPPILDRLLSYDARLAQHRSMRTVIDGLGADRIAQAIASILL